MTGSNLGYGEFQHHGGLEDLTLQSHDSVVLGQDPHGLLQDHTFGSSENLTTGNEQDMEKFINAFLQV